MENNSKITDIKNLKYILKREGYYWSDIIDHTNSKEIFELTSYFYIVSGWKEHSSQQKPLKPGEAKNRLKKNLE